MDFSVPKRKCKKCKKIKEVEAIIMDGRIKANMENGKSNTMKASGYLCKECCKKPTVVDIMNYKTL